MSYEGSRRFLFGVMVILCLGALFFLNGCSSMNVEEPDWDKVSETPALYISTMVDGFTGVEVTVKDYFNTYGHSMVEMNHLGVDYTGWRFGSVSPLEAMEELTAIIRFGTFNEEEYISITWFVKKE